MSEVRGPMSCETWIGGGNERRTVGVIVEMTSDIGHRTSDILHGFTPIVIVPHRFGNNMISPGTSLTSPVF